ncbi:hypothetical protein JXL83_07335 [candidate division WOR-3 bacterium]|nr:hypothetical protein [candidate division WOR-3 bacterium]
MDKILIGEILIDQGHIDSETLKEALQIQKDKKKNGEEKKLGEILIDQGWIEEGILFDALFTQSKKKNEN